jgi:hypothetical protein
MMEQEWWKDSENSKPKSKEYTQELDQSPKWENRDQMPGNKDGKNGQITFFNKNNTLIQAKWDGPNNRWTELNDDELPEWAKVDSSIDPSKPPQPLFLPETPQKQNLLWHQEDGTMKHSGWQLPIGNRGIFSRKSTITNSLVPTREIECKIRFLLYDDDENPVLTYENEDSPIEISVKDLYSAKMKPNSDKALNLGNIKSKTREQPLQIILQPNERGNPYPDGNQENLKRTLNQAIQTNANLFTRLRYRGGKTKKQGQKPHKKTVRFRKQKFLHA